MPSWKSLRPFMIAALAIVPAGAGAALLFVESGLYDVGAASPHNLFSEWLTHETMIHSVRRHSRGIAVSAGFDAAQVLSGFCAYQVHCAACHGAPGVARQLWATGMEPSPPYLIDVSRRFRPEELFWMVKNGIKMTGMPSWNNEMSDAQIWSVVAWLEVGPKLAPHTYVRWRAADKCRGAIGLPSLDPKRPSTHRP